MSRTGYPRVKHVVNINTDMSEVTHYNHTTALFGEARFTLRRLIKELRAQGAADRLTAFGHRTAAGLGAWQEFKQSDTTRPCFTTKCGGGKS